MTDNVVRLPPRSERGRECPFCEKVIPRFGITIEMPTTVKFLFAVFEVKCPHCGETLHMTIDGKKDGPSASVTPIRRKGEDDGEAPRRS